MDEEERAIAAWRVPSQIERFYQPVAAGLVHGRMIGKGPPVLLIHDLPGSGRLVEDSLITLAQWHYKAIAFDVPGFGQSDPAADVVRAMVEANAPFGPMAVICWPGSVGLAQAMVAQMPQARLVCVMDHSPGPIAKPELSPDGQHLAELWPSALHAAGNDPARAQKNLAEWLLTKPEGWAMMAVGHMPSTHDAPPLIGDLGKARPLLLACFDGAIRSTKYFANGAYGRLHVRKMEPLSGASKTPLICFHASPLSGVVYEPLGRAMAHDRLVLMPDTPGFGESDTPDAPQSISQLAEALFQAVIGEQSGPVDLFGFHTGSMIAAELAAKYPDRIRRVAMISAPLFTETERAWFKDHYRPKPELSDGSHNVDRWQTFWPWRGPRQTIENYARNHAQGLRGGPSHHWGHKAAFDHDMASCFARMMQPVLVFNPNDDLAEQSRRAAALVRDGQVLELPDCGHGMLDSDTALLAGHLRTFFDSDRV